MNNSSIVTTDFEDRGMIVQVCNEPQFRNRQNAMLDELPQRLFQVYIKAIIFVYVARYQWEPIWNGI